MAKNIQPLALTLCFEVRIFNKRPPVVGSLLQVLSTDERQHGMRHCGAIQGELSGIRRQIGFNAEQSAAKRGDRRMQNP
jgi:hypothetical protein